MYNAGMAHFLISKGKGWQSTLSLQVALQRDVRYTSGSHLAATTSGQRISPNCSVLTQPLRIPDQHYFLSPRNRKKQAQDKETPEMLHPDDSRMKENSSLSHLKETLISEKLDLPLGETELNEKDAAQVFFLPDPQEPES